ncbi:MAG: hypothetical protein NC311_03980 [Muribaculaceae bacterium]|nr:hypothetical protein [Muribaculaceae bacterium]
MKIKHFIVTLPCMTLGIISNAFALSAGTIGGGTGTEITMNSCSVITCTSNAQVGNEVTTGCADDSITKTYTCYKDEKGNTYKYISCATCMSGYKLVTYDVSKCCGNSLTGECTHQYKMCAPICPQGSYVNTSGTGCAACPSYGGASGTTSGTGAISITECYIPSGTYSDSTGTYKITENCYYK